ncbi:exodeoxyribonuclease VII large subunit [Erysipelothrix enhydrae]|uniref:exodeoxyribonuclease VII large subunit n=1 Tax=Erysipelothrix enhydrae TaxID=2890314 RepID=UPI002B24CB4F|nr:exodeoxyribonuclease VII large subunit [Erysipelothrix sp. 4322-04]WRB86855.1 exodeoxyribonuclease VII large subunit [Erysipelothrix sp. 4322-04]
MITQDVITVTEFVNELKGVIDQHPSFKNVALVGELSNFKAHHSGHFYFSLKDDKSRITCAMFRRSASKVLFRPKDGDKVVIFGRCEVYTDTGTVQIYADRMNLDGLGDLYIQFEKLKKDFEDRGYFNPKHRKKIPKYPQRIAVIVGENSAAYADITRTLQERWPIAKQIDLLAYVQGDNASKSLVQQIQRAHHEQADTIILGRGGGSIEDLWAFNTPEVVEAIFKSEIPIISGIGHESDVTLSDFVSDYRAATPTAAAVAATPNWVEMQAMIRDYKNQYYLAVRNKYLRRSGDYTSLIQSSALKDPVLFVERKQQKLDTLTVRITHQQVLFDESKRMLALISNRMENSLLLKYNNSSNIINQYLGLSSATIQQKMTQSLQKVEMMRSRFDFYSQYIDRSIKQNQGMIQQYDERFYSIMERGLNLKKERLNDILKSLKYRSPLDVIQRNLNQGYIIPRVNDIHVVNAESVNVDDRIQLEFRDGFVLTQVISKESKDE